MTQRTSSRTLAFLVLLLALGTPALRAQTVRGTLVDEGSGSPLAATLVVLVDAAGKQVGGALSGADGAFLLRAPGAGRYELRAERIGVRGAASRSLELAEGQTLELRLTTPAAAAFSLEGLEVRRERKRCRALPEAGEQAAAVWEEVRKALGVAAWTERQRAFTFRLARHERELDPSTLAVRREAAGVVAAVASNPLRSLPPAELAERGYVASRGDTVLYFAPDAEVLLSDEFLNAHCFWVEPGGAEEPGLVGLAFEPTRAAARTGIRGVLWVDRATAQLRHLDFRYPTLDLAGPTQHLGGRVEFGALPGGAWMVRRWRIRMPRVVQRVGRYAEARVVSSAVQGIREEGGEIVEIRTLDGELVRAAGRARLAGVVYDGASAAPLPGAEVRLAGTSWTTRTDEQGRFGMTDLPEGTYRVEVSHPHLDSLAVGPPGRDVALRRDAEARLELATPSKREILARLCPGGIARDQGVLLGTVRGGAGTVQGTTVTVDWSRWDVGREQDRNPSSAVIVEESRTRTVVTLDDQDRYRVCGVPAGVALRVHVEAAGARGRAETVRVAAGEVRTLDPATPSRAAGAAPAREPVALEGVTVVGARRQPRLEAAGFYDRRKMGAGVFFSDAQLEGKDLIGLIRSGGVQVRRMTRGFAVFVPRAFGSKGPCLLPVFVDGVYTRTPDTHLLLTTPIVAVEVYRDHAEVPPRFRALSLERGCGAVVVWTAPSP